MNAHRAPLYVETHDLARWVAERAGDWKGAHAHQLGARIVGAASDLAVAAARALTCPATRRRDLQNADEAIVRLRTLLRLARDLGLLTRGGTRFAQGRLREIGRMVGGWRKTVARGRREEHAA